MYQLYSFTTRVLLGDGRVCISNTVKTKRKNNNNNINNQRVAPSSVVLGFYPVLSFRPAPYTLPIHNNIRAGIHFCLHGFRTNLDMRGHNHPRTCFSSCSCPAPRKCIICIRHYNDCFPSPPWYIPTLQPHRPFSLQRPV